MSATASAPAATVGEGPIIGGEQDGPEAHARAPHRQRSGSEATSPSRFSRGRHSASTLALYTVFAALLFLWTCLQFKLYRLHRGWVDSSATTVLGGARTAFEAYVHDDVHEMDRSRRLELDYMFVFFVLTLMLLPSFIKRALFAIFRREKKVDEEQFKQKAIHNKLLRTYLPAYLLATSADWLQGPYKYALYSNYGYTQRDIAHLFVAGYGSGMLLGSFVGGFADSMGRKRLCLGYCVAFSLGVLMKHFKNFYLLLFGRVCGGIGTSLLFSVFESWVIGAHTARGLSAQSGLTKKQEESFLAKSLSLSMYGSSFVAIGSGVMANFVVGNSGKMRPIREGSSIYYGGYIAAFDCCLVPLMLCATLISVFWEENYGRDAGQAVPGSTVKRHFSDAELPSLAERKRIAYAKKHSSMFQQDDQAVYSSSTDEETQMLVFEDGNEQTGERFKLRKGSAIVLGASTVWSSPNILACCVIGSIYEGVMYIFIFLWTPCLSRLQQSFDDTGEGSGDETNEATNADVSLPFGWIFSSFMVCCMLGTMSFSQLTRWGVPPSRCLLGVLALSSVSCLAMAGSPSTLDGRESSANTTAYIAMLCYEFCIGAYFPSFGVIKGTIVPENQRAAIYNVFRLPLNLIVLLYLVGDFSIDSSFRICGCLLLVAAAIQTWLIAKKPPE